MQRRSNPPQQHATRDPPDHTISPTKRRARGLQRDEEGKEEHNRCIEIAFVEAYVGREMRRLCVADLGFQLAIHSSLSGALPLPLAADAKVVWDKHTFDLSSELNRNNVAKNGRSKQSSFSTVRRCTRACASTIVRCRRRRIFPLTSPSLATWVSALPSACIKVEGVEGVDVDVAADVRVSSYREPAISRRETGSGVGGGGGITAALHARWAGSDHLPCARGRGRVRVRGWVRRCSGGCSAGVCGALRSWGLFVLGFRCVAWTLRL
jgi:hypothetical protein